MSGLYSCMVRTTHGKTRLRAKRSFGPVPVPVDLTEHEMDLINADPFLELRVWVGANPALALAAQQELDEQAAKVPPDADAKLDVPGNADAKLDVPGNADAKLAVKPTPKATKKAKG